MDCRVYRAVRASTGVLVPELAPRERRPRLGAARAKGAETLPGHRLPSTAFPTVKIGLAHRAAHKDFHSVIPPRSTDLAIGMSTGTHRVLHWQFSGFPQIHPQAAERSQTDQLFASSCGVRPVLGGRRFALSAVPFQTETPPGVHSLSTIDAGLTHRPSTGLSTTLCTKHASL